MEEIIYKDNTLFVSRSRVVVEQTTHYVDDIDSIDFHVERHYALIRLGLAGGGEHLFAPPNRAQAMLIVDALTKALSEE